jgi:hypothetical protein
VVVTDDTATLLVDFEKLATSGAFTTVVGGTNVTFGTATSVKLNGGAITSVTANAANVVQLWAANNAANLTISATKAASVITIAGTVLTGTAGGALSVVGSSTSVLNAAAVTKVTSLAVTAKTVDFTALASATGAVALTNTTPVAFPALTTATTISAPAAVSFTASVLKTVTSLGLGVATTIEAPVTEVAIGSVTALAVTSLTLGTNAVVTSTTGGAGLDLLFPALKTLWLNGTGAYTGVDITSDPGTQNEAITSIKLSGKFGAVNLLGVGASIVTKIETAGNFTSTSVVDFDLMTVLTLENGHNPTAAGGHILMVDDNALLTAFTTTNLDFVQNLTITNNPKLASFDLSSVKSLLLTSVAYSIDISGNFSPNPVSGTLAAATGMKGSFTAAVPQSGSVARVAANLTQASLATLKPFILAIANGDLASTPTVSDTVINLTYLIPNAGTPANADTATFAVTTGTVDANDVADLNSL